jgi:enoyl-CoA hydratase/carnithine racemase
VDFEQIRAEHRDNVLVLTLNRPERLNAWTPRMSRELGTAISAANDDTGTAAIVVTGAGRGFCAGADIEGEFAANLDSSGEAPDVAATTSNAPARDWVWLCRQSKPLLAAVNGPAIGVGLTMILPFDRIVAARNAKISCRFVKMGLVPELASSHFLVARCGWGTASWLAMSGATITGEEAASLRLVDRAVDDTSVLDEAIADARVLASNPGPQLRMIKDLLTRNATETDLALVQRREGEALAVAYRTPEHHEAVRAFLEKRAPDFGSMAGSR